MRETTVVQEERRDISATFDRMLLQDCYRCEGRWPASAKVKKLARRHLLDRESAVGEKTMPDDFRLLLKSIVAEPLYRLKLVSVAAEGMPHQGQIKPAALLSLPDMGELMHEIGLLTERLLRKIVGSAAAVRVEPDAAARRHRGTGRVEGPPLAFDQLHLRVIDRVAEHRACERDFTGGEGTGDFRHCEEPKETRQSMRLDCFAALAMTSESYCPGETASLGQRKSQTEEAVT